MNTHTDSEIALMRQVLQIFKAFDEELPKGVRASLTHREGGPNPYYNRTSSGLYLEFYYGHPARLWTPWGEWHISGTVSNVSGMTEEERNAGFMARLTAEAHQPLTRTVMGEVGPIYKLLAVDGVLLPEPGKIEEFHRLPSDGFTKAKEHWKSLVVIASAGAR